MKIVKIVVQKLEKHVDTVAQYGVFYSQANRHLDIRGGVGRDACVVRDGVGG